jgi:RNA polymerase-binding transcription factor DksA
MSPSSRNARRIRARLDTRRRELLVRYKETLEQADTELARESGEIIDVANDQWDARVLAIMGEHDALALENVVAALHRLDSGKYGRCTSCGDRVNAERLRVLPEVARCTECATRRERRRTKETFAASLT